MSISSLSSSVCSPYGENNALMFPRLTTPRDLVIPGSVSSKSRNVNVRVSIYLKIFFENPFNNSQFEYFVHSKIDFHKILRNLTASVVGST